MSLSLNEVEATARKAARGAGYPWAVAEEAGWAVGWLCRAGQDGVGALARHVVRVDPVDLGSVTPDVSRRHWEAEGGALCPLLTGAAFLDRVALISEDDCTVGRIGEPLLLLPFVAEAARVLERAIMVGTERAEASLLGDRGAITGDFVGIAEELLFERADAMPPAFHRESRASPVEADWRVLLEYAHRTYAPGTEASRLRGAGAGLFDND